jgi:hypothetical protein
MHKANSLLQIISLAVLIVCCSNTQLTSLWKDPAYSGPPLKKIMVIAFRRDQVNRRMWEDAVVTAISQQKTTASAVPSYGLFPNEVPQPDSINVIVKDQGFDGVLIVSKIERDTLTNEVPGYTTTEPVTEYSRRWKSYVTHYEDVYHAGHTDTSTAVSVQSDLLLTQGNEGRLVWSATSQSVNPTSRAEFRAAIANTVAKQLTKAQLIP